LLSIVVDPVFSEYVRRHLKEGTYEEKKLSFGNLFQIKEGDEKGKFRSLIRKIETVPKISGFYYYDDMVIENLASAILSGELSVEVDSLVYIF